MSEIGKPCEKKVYEPIEFPVPAEEPSVVPEKKIEEPEPQEVPA